jgi:hypothetical protein
MSKFTIVNEMSGPSYFSVHAAGCQDLAKHRCNGMWDNEAGSIAEAVAREVEEMESEGLEGYTAGDFRVMPCAKKLAAKS